MCKDCTYWPKYKKTKALFALDTPSGCAKLGLAHKGALSQLTGVSTMPMDRGVLGMGDDMCSCGRKKSVTHCPRCGSIRLYPYAGPTMVESPFDPTKEEPALGVFRCTKCNKRFTTHHECLAPSMAPASDTVISKQDIKEAKAVKLALTAASVVNKHIQRRALNDAREILPLDPAEFEEIKKANPEGFVIEKGRKMSFQEYVQGQMFEEFFELNEVGASPVEKANEWISARCALLDFSGFTTREFSEKFSSAPTEMRGV